MITKLDCEIIKAREVFRNTDDILIGASNGLSISEGHSTEKRE